jgi:cytoskeletal protein RodZ
MRKIWILNIGMLLMAGVAVAGEDMIQSETKVKEKTSHSATVQEDGNQAQKDHESTTVEKQHQATTSEDMDGDTTTRDKIETENKHSQTTTLEDTDSSSPGSEQEYRHQSETHHQHTTKEVEKN